MAKKTNGVTLEKKKSATNIDLKQFLSEIEKRAYEIYQKRILTNSKGDEFSDWIKAESDIKTKYKL